MRAYNCYCHCHCHYIALTATWKVARTTTTTTTTFIINKRILVWLHKNCLLLIRIMMRFQEAFFSILSMDVKKVFSFVKLIGDLGNRLYIGSAIQHFFSTSAYFVNGRLSSCLIWTINSFILPLNEYGCVYV